MILPIAALLLQITTVSANTGLGASRAETIRAALVDKGSEVGVDGNAGSSSRTSSPDLPSAPEPGAPKDSSPTYAAEPRPFTAPLPLSARTSLSQSMPPDRSEKTRRREWMALAIAEHSAAGFDAWSTRRALATGDAQESNPMLRPFAGNASIYAAIQIAPVLFDYVSRRMMNSEHGWARHTWWVLQAVSTATSLGSGAHNLTIR